MAAVHRVQRSSVLTACEIQSWGRSKRRSAAAVTAQATNWSNACWTNHPASRARPMPFWCRRLTPMNWRGGMSASARDQRTFSGPPHAGHASLNPLHPLRPSFTHCLSVHVCAKTFLLLLLLLCAYMLARSLLSLGLMIKCM